MAGINVYGQQIYITLIARRSSIYAGTRFMKRGCNVTVRFALKNFYISVKSVFLRGYRDSIWILKMIIGSFETGKLCMRKIRNIIYNVFFFIFLPLLFMFWVSRSLF